MIINKIPETSSIIKTFKDVNFIEDSHSYYVGREKLKMSISSLDKYFKEEVDFTKIAAYKDRSEGYPQGTHKILWRHKADLACALGTKVHFFGEVYCKYKNIFPRDGYEEAITKFWNDLPEHIIPVFTELVMYHKEKRIGGTADIILFNTKTKKFIIADYKTNEQLFDCYKGKKLKGIFSDLEETNFNKYQIQLNGYKLLFEQTGFEVEKMVVVWIKSNGTYEKHFVKDFSDKLKDFIDKEI